MTREQAIKFANCLKNNYTIDIYAVADFCDMVINALEIVEEFERARIITGGRLNGRTYAYKCGLEDGKRKALEQQPSEDCVSRKAMLNAITEIDNNVNMDIYTNEVREIVKELPPVTLTHGTCKNCEHWKDSDGVYRRGVDAESKCPINIKEVCEGKFFCKDFEKRGKEEV